MSESIDVNVREPTGLELGRFDMFSVCQKIYEGELHHQCEYLTSHEEWLPLTTHPRFRDVFWLLGEEADGTSARKTTRFKGWATKNTSAEPRHQAIDLDRTTRRLNLEDRSKPLKARELLGETAPVPDRNSPKGPLRKD